ncbi:uncharacterized protein I206_105713 [Kwoniella pini CBS 10737]|uniref:Uncharacterized protein n=1 Tax=Kwoniella pini CBS 10737 TaxID=1296096 RepID=A0A1B9I3L0_9TREE|nr:uncharacterized protein I206_03384 [Kwoniella pini CBS 10737]OCF50068.1 hypothetical protein I206_03384 [Kwoniella pini CBS 10737]
MQVQSVNQGSDWDKVKIITPSPILGYGYPEEDLWRGVEEHGADAIIVDAGSTDGGPDDLALNHTVVSKEMYERDLAPMIDAVYKNGLKLLISSAGGAGPKAHVDFLKEIITDLINQKGYTLKVAAIYTDVSKETVLSKLKEGKVHPCGEIPELKIEDVEKTDAIVAQVGHEPFLKALREEPDIIIGGRAYDPAPFIAYCLHRLGKVSHATAWHMGKIMECGGICAIPKGKVILATVSPDNFELLPMDPNTRCTELSVAAHTLYEKTRPDKLAGPGGILDITNAKYQQISARGVRVSGAVIERKPTAFKLEGARQVGFKTVFLGGIRDPILIKCIDEFTQKTWEMTAKMFPVLKSDPSVHQLQWKFYGRNAVMAHLEPCSFDNVHEIGLYGEVLAPTQRLANAIANCARVGILHGAYPGQVATAGNFASPGTPLELSAGPACEFTIYHLMDIDDPEDFPVDHFTVGKGSDSRPTKPVHGHDTTHEQTKELIPLNPEPAINNFLYGGSPFFLPDLARVVRSKNSGPYEITFDVMFATLEDYQFVKGQDKLNKEFVKKSWKVENDDDILALMWFEPALAWKCTIKRSWDQGSFGERDTFGTAQHAPLMMLKLGEGLRN